MSLPIVPLEEVNVLSQQIKTAKDEKNYEQVITLVNQVKPLFALCREQPGSSKAGLQFTESKIYSIYCTALYHLYIKTLNDMPSDQQLEDFDKALKYILIKTEEYVQRPDMYKYWCYPQALFKALEHYKNKPGHNKNLLNYCDRLEKVDLSTESRKTQDGKSISSEREKLFMSHARALLDGNQWETCIDYCKNAIILGDTLTTDSPWFHNENRDWLMRNEALSIKNLGRTQEALDMLLELRARLSHWAVDRDIADIYVEIGDVDKALRHYSAAALNGVSANDQKAKKNLYIEMGRMLAERDAHTAFLHLLLMEQVAKKEKWTIKQQDMQLLEKLRENAFPEPDNKALILELSTYWESQIFLGEQEKTGKIHQILKGAGFIVDENGERFYFRMSEYKGEKELYIGQHVLFYTAKGYDKKKNRTTLNAVHVRRADSGAIN